MNPLDLIVDYLKQLKDLALEHLRGSTAGLLDDDEIRWCLTVPAIWTDREKQMMRVAAQRAGMIETSPKEADRLLLVLEPEAAALHCLDEDFYRGKSRLPSGTRFLVVDAGGGTVDLTVHEVRDDGLKEMIPGSGGRCGSTYIANIPLLGRQGFL